VSCVDLTHLSAQIYRLTKAKTSEKGEHYAILMM